MNCMSCYFLSTTDSVTAIHHTRRFPFHWISCQSLHQLTTWAHMLYRIYTMCVVVLYNYEFYDMVCGKFYKTHAQWHCFQYGCTKQVPCKWCDALLRTVRIFWSYYNILMQTLYNRWLLIALLFNCWISKLWFTIIPSFIMTTNRLPWQCMITRFQ